MNARLLSIGAGLARTKSNLSLNLLPCLLPGLLLAMLALPARAEEPVTSRLSLRTYTDFGHLVRGTNEFAPEGYPSHISMQPLNRAGFVAIQEVTSGNFDVSAGIAGLLWWPYGGTSITDADERSMQGRASIPVARARWRFGDDEALKGSLMLGTFSHKYNPDAKNLGEYLYRSGTYPGFLWTTEGWLLMNRASHYGHGVMLSVEHFGGAVKHNLSLLMQTTYFPVGDFSPGYDMSFKSKWVELGGGAVLNNYLSLKPSQLIRNDPENTLIRKPTGTDSLGDTTWFVGPAEAADLSDPATEVLHRWTHKGIKVMGRGALNLNHLLPAHRRNPEDLRLFAEVAVLGWDDQPLYYEDRKERMPVMFGVNVPTFRLLDVLTVQAEHYKAPFNDIDRYNSASLPIWEANFAIDTTTFTYELDENDRVIPTRVHKDDWKWSIYAKKTVNKIMTVHAQAASDHLRLMSGPRYISVSRVPLTSTPKEWYYLVRLEFALR
jgi:hypothetical protein